MMRNVLPRPWGRAGWGLPLLLAVALSPAAGLAATWQEVEVEDPLTGYKITVHEPVDMTGDIYQWPSRRDLVYWPHTDEHWIWHSPHSDYVSFGNDFSKLTEEEKQRIRKYLRHHRIYVGKEITTAQKLDQMEAIYKLRDKDEDFWLWFYRVQAYWHRDDEKRARGYHEKLISLLEKRLPNVDEGIERIKTLYLLGEYTWRLGDRETATGYFTRARKISWTDEKGRGHQGIQYIDDLIDERLFSSLIELQEEREAKKKKEATVQVNKK